MEKEFYKTLIAVLDEMHDNPKVHTPMLKRISDDKWDSIREYLNENRLVTFASADSLFDIQKTKVGKHRDKARMELAKIEKAEADRRLDRISKRTSIVISIAAFAVSLISLYFSLTREYFISQSY